MVPVVDMNKKIYYQELDIVKGIAILLVIMGHAFTNHPVDIKGNMPELFQFMINNAQMPLFFVASGFLFNLKERWNVIIYKKTFRILIPYLAFSIITLVLRTVFASYTNSGAPSITKVLISVLTGGYYWFLYGLMVMMIICRLLGTKQRLIIIALGSIFISIVLPENSPIIVQKIFHYLFFFISGVFMKSVYHSISINNWKFYLIVSLFSFVIYVTLGNYQYIIVKLYIAPTFGCIAFWSISIVIRKCFKRELFLSYFGRYSLQYYLNHLLIVLPCYYLAKYIGFHSSFASWLVIVCATIFISFVMFKLEKQYYISRLICGFQSCKANKLY